MDQKSSDSGTGLLAKVTAPSVGPLTYAKASVAPARPESSCCRYSTGWAGSSEPPVVRSSTRTTRELRQHDDAGLLVHLFYTDPAGERVAISLGDWRDVREVRYAYLKGATPIVVEMLVGSDGEPLHKRKLAGHTTMRVDELFYDYYGTYGVYAPIHVGTIVTHPTYGE